MCLRSANLGSCQKSDWLRTLVCAKPTGGSVRGVQRETAASVCELGRVEARASMSSSASTRRFYDTRIKSESEGSESSCTPMCDAGEGQWGAKVLLRWRRRLAGGGRAETRARAKRREMRGARGHVNECHTPKRAAMQEKDAPDGPGCRSDRLSRSLLSAVDSLLLPAAIRDRQMKHQGGRNRFVRCIANTELDHCSASSRK